MILHQVWRNVSQQWKWMGAVRIRVQTADKNITYHNIIHITNIIHNNASTSAAGLIECDSHAHLVSKAGSVISSKSPSGAFRWSGIYYTEPWFTDKLRKNIADDIIMKLKKSFVILTAVCVASQWTTARCSKCCSIWKHVKTPHFSFMPKIIRILS